MTNNTTNGSATFEYGKYLPAGTSTFIKKSKVDVKYKVRMEGWGPGIYRLC